MARHLHVRAAMTGAPEERYEATTAVAQAVVVDLLPRVEQLARKLARRLPSHVSLEDLVSAGTLGLIDAARRYDPAVCDRFGPFADHRIRGAMLDELRSHDCLSRELRAQSRKREKAIRALHRRLGRAPSSDEIAEEMGFEVERYQELLGKVHRGHSPSAEAVTRDGVGAQAFVDADAPDPCEVTMAKERRDLLAKAIAELPERLQLVVSLYYKEGLTLAQIGSILGVTEARACQLRGESIGKLRRVLESWEIECD